MINFIIFILLMTCFISYVYLWIKGFLFEVKLFKEFKFTNYNFKMIFCYRNWYNDYNIKYGSQEFLKYEPQIKKQKIICYKLIFIVLLMIILISIL